MMASKAALSPPRAAATRASSPWGVAAWGRGLCIAAVTVPMPASSPHSIPTTDHWMQRISKRFRSEEHTSELQSLMRISYAVFCLNKKKHTTQYSNLQLYEQN